MKTRQLALQTILAGALAACTPEESAPAATSQTMSEAGTASAPERSLPDAPARSAEALLARLQSGDITSEDAVAAYLARIAAIDRAGPRINSIIHLNPDALDEARALDAEREAGEIRGPLHGLPVLVKDNIETRETPTTAGSLALAENTTGRDAAIIARLREAGAIILGKTNLSEWANFRSFDSISGWSAVGGQTLNPHNTTHTPCGSSSGSGAAVAALLAPAAIGTETNGSIICPGAMSGIVGFKPTVGLLSRRHIVPIAVSHDTAGPMTRTVRDAALLLQVMAGEDPEDPATEGANDRKTDYLADVERGVNGMRIGAFRWAEGDDPEISAAFNAALSSLQMRGAIIVDIDEFSPDPVLEEKGLALLLAEFKDGVNRYLDGAADGVETRSLESLIAFNAANAELEMPMFDQSIFLAAAAAPDLDDPEYAKIRDAILAAAGPKGVDALLKAHKVELLVMPAGRPAELIRQPDSPSEQGGEKASVDRVGAGWLAAMAGYPVATVPMGDVDGLPIGLAIVGSAWDDGKVLAAARAYEKATNKIREPAFRTRGD